MKIGVFGDSYADVSDKDENPQAWPCVVQHSLNAEVDYYARSGTSMWWSYQKFKEHYKKYDVIIFCFTSATRWPSLPDEIEVGRQFNIGHTKDNSLLDKLNPFFFSLFPDKLREFLCGSIQRDIVETCKNEDKYLVQVIPFIAKYSDQYRYDFDMYTNNFPIISGLDAISHKEVVLIDNKKINTGKLLRTTYSDHRACHLNTSNNKIVADWIIGCITDKKYDVNFECEKYNDWVWFDSTDSSISMTTLNLRRM